MAYTDVPLIVDPTLSPLRVREVPDVPGRGVPPRVIPPASPTQAGGITAAEYVQLVGTPAAIAAAVASEATTRSNADSTEASARAAADSSLDSRVSSLETGTPGAISTAVAAEAVLRAAGDSTEASARAAGDTALDGRLDTLEAGFAALDPLAEENKARNLTTAALLAPPEELGIFKQRDAGTGELELRPVHPGALLEARLVGDSILVGARPPIYVPVGGAGRRSQGYRPVRRQGRRTAGAQGDTTKLADNHGSAHRYPLMLWAGLDTYGFPHNRHKRLESDNAGNDSGELGYQFGHDVYPGDFRDGRALKFFGRGRAQNVGWADAFWDWAVEVNPTVGVYAGPYRLRMPGPELGATWAGENLFDWEVTLRSEGWKTYSVVGKWTIFDENGAELKSWSRAAWTDLDGYDFLDDSVDSARVQLSWRVDKDRATRLDTFDSTNQGANQGANLLRCSVTNYGLDWDGFPKG